MCKKNKHTKPRHNILEVFEMDQKLRGDMILSRIFPGLEEGQLLRYTQIMGQPKMVLFLIIVFHCIPAILSVNTTIFPLLPKGTDVLFCFLCSEVCSFKRKTGILSIFPKLWKYFLIRQLARINGCLVYFYYVVVLHPGCNLSYNSSVHFASVIWFSPSSSSRHTSLQTIVLCIGCRMHMSFTRSCCFQNVVPFCVSFCKISNFKSHHWRPPISKRTACNTLCVRPETCVDILDETDKIYFGVSSNSFSASTAQEVSTLLPQDKKPSGVRVAPVVPDADAVRVFIPS